MQSSAELKYVPDQWADEVTPTPQLTPDAFIIREGEDWILRPAAEDDAEDLESFAPIRVRHGDTVMFHEHRNFGSFILYVDDEGEWDVDGDYPDYANCFAMSGDYESMTDNIPDLIGCSEIDPGSSYDIEIWWWSDTGFPWQFVVEGDAAKFVKLEGVA
ncbi:hypothetical protein ACO34A_03530 [Rhizobium sp. ACO-34A]|nr:hypothetical protein [Rhizobium sp. ACO-34A]ATN32871.1 hypothetical protein ACO34A_03530 [Rhizobium sp. ACO-34A]